MLRARVIPCLLLKDDGLVKTVRFGSPRYLGDPINAVRIFNDKEVDELMLLDISATPDGRKPDFDRVQEIASESFMPICYGGGVGSVDQAKRLFGTGVEKVALNTAASENPGLVSAIANASGSQSVVVSVDVKRDWLRRRRVFSRCGRHNTGRDPVDYVREMVDRGAGEIFLNSIDRDGIMSGLDTELIREVTSAASVPVVACGGAGSVAHLGEAIAAGASGVAAGSLFVYSGPQHAVLISYPSSSELDTICRQAGGRDR